MRLLHFPPQRQSQVAPINPTRRRTRADRDAAPRKRPERPAPIARAGGSARWARSAGASWHPSSPRPPAPLDAGGPGAPGAQPVAAAVYPAGEGPPLAWVARRVLAPSRLAAALPGAVAALLLALWGHYFLLAWQTRGLFAWLGFDYGYFWAVTRVVLEGGPRAAYDPTLIAHASQALLPYYAPGQLGQDRPLTVAAPWPPVLWLYYAPFTLLPLPLGYLAWLVTNAALAVVVVHDLARHLDWPPWQRWTAALLALTFFPVAYTLFFGQPSILWLAALSRAFLAFERRQEMRAGLWAGALLLKPQYAVFLGLVLCYKRRWRAGAGMGAAALGLAGSSLLVLGPRGVLAYVDAVRALTGFRLAEPLIAPHLMISWRGLLLNALPTGAPDAAGLALSAALAALTASILLVVWRGAWDPQGVRFPQRLLATMLVTMLASFHNHAHGATLLVVPAMALAARSASARALPTLMVAALLVPAALIFAGTSGVAVATCVIALMAAALVILVVQDLRSASTQANRSRASSPAAISTA